jgi:hypothetical protein
VSSTEAAQKMDCIAAWRITWKTCAILVAILALGAGLRFYEITRVGQWPDEFWSSVHLATGRGVEIFDAPSGVLLDPPPQTLLDGAPHWWHIWTGLRGIVHPPLYLVFLRWWMDLFGTGDFATRTFSVLASLAAAVVLFDIVRRMVSAHAGLLAALVMVISAAQIDLSQETRPYPFLALVALLACHAIVRIEQNGPTTRRLFQLGFAVAATALTHYFSFGALIGIAGYVLFRFRGSMRKKTLATMAIAAVFVLIVWGPFLWQQHREFFRQGAWAVDASQSWRMPFIRAIAIPSDFLYGRIDTRVAWIAPAVIAYLLPFIWIRRYPQVMLWWFWIVGAMGSITIYDCLNHGVLLAHVKYTSLAAVGIYALCAVPLPMQVKWRWIVPYMMLFSVAITTVMRVQEGPSEANGDWRGLALAVDHYAGPHDAFVFYPDNFWGSPAMFYLAVDHYAANHNRPIMLLEAPPDVSAMRQLLGFKRIWFIGPAPQRDIRTYFPDWKPGRFEWFPNAGAYVELTSPDLPSHPEHRLLAPPPEPSSASAR